MYFGTEAAGMRRVAYYSSNFVKWSLLATFVGLFVGGISTLFGHLLLFVNSYRYAHEQVVWLLPFAGLAIVFLYRISDSANPRGTNLVIEAARSEEKLPARMAPLIFVSTILTHLCGGSAGREGAALQLGGSLGQLLGDKLRIEEENRNIMVMCGLFRPLRLPHCRRPLPTGTGEHRHDLLYRTGALHHLLPRLLLGRALFWAFPRTLPPRRL